MITSVIWSPGMSLEKLEESVVMTAFRFYHSNKTITATALGISIRTLDHKLEKYELDQKKEKEDHESRSAERDRQLARARGIQVATEGQAESPQVRSRIRMESVAEDQAQPSVPVPERQEVQEMLLDHAAASRPGRRRERV